MLDNDGKILSNIQILTTEPKNSYIKILESSIPTSQQLKDFHIQKDIAIAEYKLRVYVLFIVVLHKYSKYKFNNEYICALNKLLDDYFDVPTADKLQSHSDLIYALNKSITAIPCAYTASMLCFSLLASNSGAEAITGFLNTLIEVIENTLTTTALITENFIERIEIKTLINKALQIPTREQLAYCIKTENNTVFYNPEYIDYIKSVIFKTAESIGIRYNPPSTSITGNISQQTSLCQSDQADTELDTAIAELNDLTGLKSVKDEVNKLISHITITKLKKEKGIKTPPLSLHLVFTGNPGTGKTTVARLIAKIYKALGLIQKNEILEVARQDLVAGYVGQTAIKTQEVINRAMGGILFIDEAYTLSTGNDNDYGQEAIDTVLKAMEDNRENLIVIVAGYTKEIGNFIKSNPGLSSRFNNYIFFPDYSPDELIEILLKMFYKNDYIISDEVKDIIANICNTLYKNKDENFANARSIRNIFEKVHLNCEERVFKIPDPSRTDLLTILPEDFNGVY